MVLTAVVLTALMGTRLTALQSGGQAANSSAKAPPSSSSSAQRPVGMGAELARQSREAAGEDGNEQFKGSPSVRWLAKISGLDLRSAYWLAVGLNFVVVAALIFWAGRRYLPGLFRDRTAAIQKAMYEARKASEDARRRLAEVEARLAKLGDEIAAMKAAGERDVAEEEARIQAAAEDDARKIVEGAEQEIAAAAKSARRDLVAYAADLAVSLAQRQIHVDAGTDQVLVRNFADRLSDGGKGEN
ncbi:MAG TPA: ATP synthase F0 subunit B [Terriglobales bacterium]|nr:ATP synthase F0 subunit B [Terriglobales bacterium]